MKDFEYNSALQTNKHLKTISSEDRQRIVDVILDGICPICFDDEFNGVCHCNNDD